MSKFIIVFAALMVASSATAFQEERAPDQQQIDQKNAVRNDLIKTIETYADTIFIAEFTGEARRTSPQDIMYSFVFKPIELIKGKPGEQVALIMSSEQWAKYETPDATSLPLNIRLAQIFKSGERYLIISRKNDLQSVKLLELYRPYLIIPIQ